MARRAYGVPEGASNVSEPRGVVLWELRMEGSAEAAEVAEVIEAVEAKEAAEAIEGV